MVAGWMQWRSPGLTNAPKILHLSISEDGPWKPYTQFPGLALPDSRMPGGSKGWATYQALRAQGWELAPSENQVQMTEPGFNPAQLLDRVEAQQGWSTTLLDAVRGMNEPQEDQAA